MSKVPPTFLCPRCGHIVLGTADYIARGVVCPDCGQGFCPVPVEARFAAREREDNGPIWLACGLGALVCLGVGFVNVWLAASLFTFGVIIGLLIGIFVRLGQRS